MLLEQQQQQQAEPKSLLPFLLCFTELLKNNKRNKIICFTVVMLGILSCVLILNKYLRPDGVPDTEDTGVREKGCGALGSK